MCIATPLVHKRDLMVTLCFICAPTAVE